MAKRSATSALNQDNWDKEEEAEEAGVFETASSEVLQTRVIKTAKRRIRQPEYNAETKPSPFSNFTGFGKATSTSKSGQNTVASPFSSFLFKSSQQETKESEKKPNNLELLKDLNLSCSSWIAEHLEKNPFCILTPIFKDYEKHLKELNLDNELEKNNAKTEPEKPASADNSNKETPKTFSFNKEETTQSSEEEKKKPEKEKLNEFKFEGFQPMKPLNPLFGSVNTSFGSTSTQPFSLNQISAKPINSDADSKKDDEESDEPPKNDFVPVIEEDSIFDMKCKVFVKGDDNFVPRGVGTLFLKPVKDSKKTQAVVRAHTSLGNILLNILLVPGMPIQKIGKNNAMIVCVPTPDSKPPPVPVLIRVKTSDECDMLIKKLEECRGS